MYAGCFICVVLYWKKDKKSWNKFEWRKKLILIRFRLERIWHFFHFFQSYNFARNALEGKILFSKNMKNIFDRGEGLIKVFNPVEEEDEKYF